MVFGGHDDALLPMSAEAIFDGVYDFLEAQIEGVYVFFAEEKDIYLGHSDSVKMK
jgi:hypothetical protein